uniref:Uncharacterized protein n=1 Tax=Anguilla anguilla TaxID=7936 RepID=A0A0E9VG73_ANGAN
MDVLAKHVLHACSMTP